MSDGVIFNDDAADRIKKTVRHFEGSYRNRPRIGTKKVILGGGGCPPKNEKWKFQIIGTPTGGSFSFNVNVLGVTDTITINFDDTNAEIETAFETHTNIATGDVEAVGGPFPGTDITIEFKGDLESTEIPAPTDIAKSGLIGGTGVGVLWVTAQRGNPKDGSVAP